MYCIKTIADFSYQICAVLFLHFTAMHDEGQSAIIILRSNGVPAGPRI